MNKRVSSRETLLLILAPMLGTCLVQRLYLHLVRVQHIHVAGHILHHLYIGVIIAIPAAFIIAFEPDSRRLAMASRAALGIGSAMVFDEIVYLAATQASDEDYVSAVSLGGSIAFISLAAALLLLLFRLSRDNQHPSQQSL